MLAGYLGVSTAEDLSLRDEVDIEAASTELSERQRQEVSTTADLDGRAPIARVLDFLEEVLLASASGEGSEESVLTAARRLLGATGDVLKVLDTLRALVAESDLAGTSQQEFEAVADNGEGTRCVEAALSASRPNIQERWVPPPIPTRRLGRRGRGTRGTRVTALQDFHGLSSRGLGFG